MFDWLREGALTLTEHMENYFSSDKTAGPLILPWQM
jgi:hypothetical protein